MTDAGSLFGLLLVGLTAGTVTYLFLLVLVMGHRAKSPVERLLFLVFLTMFLHQSGLLLYMNTLLAPLQHDGAAKFALCVGYAGLLFLAPFLVHLHLAYFELVSRASLGVAKSLPWVFYAPVVYWLAIGFARIWRSGDPASAPDLGPHVMLTGAFLVCGVVHGMAAHRVVRVQGSRGLHVALAGFFALATLALATLTIAGRFDWRNDLPAALLMISPALPGAITAYFVLRRNFGQLGAQRNLVFAVVGGFLAVMYLTLASRASMWLAPYFPPVATISILVFVLVFLFEPLQRWLSGALKRLFRGEVEKVQRLMAEIHEQARSGNLQELVQFSEGRIAETFGLLNATVMLPGQSRLVASPYLSFPLADATATRSLAAAPHAGELLVRHEGAHLSGETHAALETLARQLPAAFDLCRTIEEKVRLERELAERELFATVGQMAASITHNLKNPLGAMKTLLQLQLENSEVPEPARNDLRMVVQEIDRTLGKLQQLLHFARPAVRAGAAAAPVDLVTITARLLELVRRDAAQRGVALLFEHPPGEVPVHAPEDALTDIFQNLVVNAIEASGRRGTIKVAIEQNGAGALFCVTDEGPGIPREFCEKIFQPFFTTKAAGTGLGLAIVQRRVMEIGGRIEFVSPVRAERGTRFTVVLP